MLFAFHLLMNLLILSERYCIFNSQSLIFVILHIVIFYYDKVSNIPSQTYISGTVSLMELIGWHNSKGNHRLLCGLPLGCFCICVY